MAAPARNWTPQTSDAETLKLGREILLAEAQAVLSVADRLDPQFCRAVDCIAACQGHVVAIGMGKCSYVGQKISATLASTGAPSYFLHPAEAMHGDLGRLRPGDVALMLSFSGETAEMVDILPALQGLGAVIVAITASHDSTLGRAARIVLQLGQIEEACSLKLAPSASTTAMLALGDALALSVSKQRQFQPEDFARFHPGGSLGRRLAKVEECMRPLETCRISLETETVREALVRQSSPGRRSGALMLVDADGRLTGVFTDSDLARLLERRRDAFIDHPLCEVMTRSPKTAAAGSRMTAALAVLAQHKLSELPVVDAAGRPLGMLDITDLVGTAEASDEMAESPEGVEPVLFPIRNKT
ncbi:KpsF/GutQ family sugar-phosphate isomerase [Lignipirellula cremea]|uniref:Arabinose 5-phosphate isomerase KpsF n=1 Tax=Lignipirellula cremea TaxID=2528010 RepID=A0A518DSU8_9BACT|nr:KpsF/GutQ family sugar-phosphate isomerase [Lignipirellula cremea]QDU94915.1 Arabinose 5-phosphate isomerase KpsF [Lignipirellula cremea]